MKRYKSVFFLFAASILFGISNSVTAWFCFVPVLFLVHSVRPKTVWLWGALYGCLSYLFYVTWLFTYSASALFGVCFVYAVYCALLFLALKGAEQFCGKAAPFVQLAVLVLYEYLKTVGFLGFSYGINGYTQYKNIYFIQTADFFGVFGVTALLDFSSVVLYQNAVFRSVENHIPTVRSTASGVTCIIDSCGRITAECGEFCTGYAFGTIPVIDRPLQQKKK